VRDPREGLVSQEPRPDSVENEFRKATRPIFQQHSSAPNDAEAYDEAGSADPREPDACVSEGSYILEAAADAVSATDSQSFLLGLIAALGRTARAPAGVESSLGTMLRCLGHALDEELDERPAFQGLVDALERRRLGGQALHEAVPIVAAFLARIVSAPVLRAGPGTAPTEIADLVRAAAQVAREALERGGARSWRALPESGSAVARRAGQRGLSISSLAEVLPRLSARLSPGRGDASTAASEHVRVRTIGKPHRMVLSGPVEIVILER
jgi:hypothetical protein